MSCVPYRFLNANGEGVADATDIACRYVEAKLVEHGSVDNAIEAVAIESGLRRTEIRKFFQPSRRPKTVHVGLWRRLLAGYLAFLKRKLLNLEHEIARVEALARADHSAVQDIHAQAEALKARIEALF